MNKSFHCNWIGMLNLYVTKHTAIQMLFTFDFYAPSHFIDYFLHVYICFGMCQITQRIKYWAIITRSKMNSVGIVYVQKSITITNHYQWTISWPISIHITLPLKICLNGIMHNLRNDVYLYISQPKFCIQFLCFPYHLHFQIIVTICCRNFINHKVLCYSF